MVDRSSSILSPELGLVKVIESNAGQKEQHRDPKPD